MTRFNVKSFGNRVSEVLGLQLYQAVHYFLYTEVVQFEHEVAFIIQMIILMCTPAFPFWAPM